MTAQVSFDLAAPGLRAGVDEAGRGPLAGPVVAAAVILDPRRRIRGIRDSKVIEPEEREELAIKIRGSAVAWSIASRLTLARIDAAPIQTRRASASTIASKLQSSDRPMKDGQRSPSICTCAGRTRRPSSARRIAR